MSLPCVEEPCNYHWKDLVFRRLVQALQQGYPLTVQSTSNRQLVVRSTIIVVELSDKLVCYIVNYYAFKNVVRVVWYYCRPLSFCDCQRSLLAFFPTNQVCRIIILDCRGITFITREITLIVPSRGDNDYFIKHVCRKNGYRM